ncbi:MAG: TonB-dependent receptor [Sideroxydans sp.]|nr:TonB-dependent receptor [Sideroxydans sp.]
MKQKFFLAALLFAAIPLAQAATDSLDEVVVTATRSEQALTQTLSHTTVITQKEIQASQAADVPALLKGLAGVEVYQKGGIGKQSSLFLRGTNSNQTLVLLDGVRINSATTGATAIEQLMPDQIERIEVVRGNASSLYGSEAIGGVIQIFTKRGKGTPSFNANIGAGSHNTQRASAGFGGEVANTAFNLQLSKFKTDGVSAISPGIVPGVNPDKDGYRNNSVSANVRHAFSDAHSLSASVFDSNGTNQFDNAFASATNVSDSKSHIQKVAVVSDNRLSANWQSKLQLSRGVDNYQDILNGVAGAELKSTNNLLTWQNTLHLAEHNVLIVGLEKLKQQVASQTLYTRTDRTDDSLFAGYTGNYGVQQVQLNLRRDKYSDFGTANTWLLGYGFDVTPAWRATASTSTAFKTPTFNDSHAPVSWGANPNLKPEQSRNSELGLHYENNEQRLNAVYFDNLIRDLIVADSSWVMQNLNEARINGLELDYNGQFGDTGVKLAATRQNPRDTQTGQALLRRAKSFSSVGIDRQFGALKMGGEWQHSGAREDNHITAYPTQRLELAAYDVVNLTASYVLDKHFNLSARVDNLFKRDYMLAHGYNTLGRTVFVGLNYKQ